MRTGTQERKKNNQQLTKQPNKQNPQKTHQTTTKTKHKETNQAQAQKAKTAVTVESACNYCQLQPLDGY